ncbi:MAG: DNA-binding domain-containing protein [Sulfuricaulis sp.]|nr:DNA-binding domain-containing protein [Sulfuricaulis sp.]
MSPLRDLQEDFRSFLLRGEEQMLQRVSGTAKVSAPKRLEIYFDAYRLRLLEALDSNYPVLHAWIGDEEFDKLGLAYLEAHPSTHFSIRYFGHRLAEYLATAEEYRDKPYLQEMASLEWAMSETFDALDSPLVSLDDMAVIPPDAWPDMRLQFHPSLHRLDLRWNVPIIWKAVNHSVASEKNADSCRGTTSSTPSPSQGEGWGEGDQTIDVPAPETSEYPQSWIVWRQNLKTYFRSLSVDEAWALDAASKGESFAALCEGLCEWIDPQNVALHAAGLLKLWITDGLVSEINLS